MLTKSPCCATPFRAEAHRGPCGVLSTEGTVAPAVISASRATDIPAFHMRWFMERLRAGWCVRINPYNSHQRTRIEFSGCRVIVFWTKDPRPLLPYLDEIRDRGFDCLVHYTINNYEAEKLEPRVPPLLTRIRAFARLAAMLGRERVIWRFDPVLTGETLPLAGLIQRIAALGMDLAPYTEKLVFSLLDLYSRPAARLRAHCANKPSLRPPTDEEIRDLAMGLRTCSATWSHPLRLATCAERVDLSAWDIEHNACIDPELLRRLHPDDPALNALNAPVAPVAPVATGALNAPGAPGAPVAPGAPGDASTLQHDQHLLPLPHALSPSGERPIIPTPRRTRAPQGGSWRPDCRCAPNRDIGTYSTCMHLCVYCYANHSDQAVIANLNRRTPGCEHL